MMLPSYCSLARQVVCCAAAVSVVAWCGGDLWAQSPCSSTDQGPLAASLLAREVLENFNYTNHVTREDMDWLDKADEAFDIKMSNVRLYGLAHMNFSTVGLNVCAGGSDREALSLTTRNLGFSTGLGVFNWGLSLRYIYAFTT